jgi:hypothetical protein
MAYDSTVRMAYTKMAIANVVIYQGEINLDTTVIITTTTKNIFHELSSSTPKVATLSPTTISSEPPSTPKVTFLSSTTISSEPPSTPKVTILNSTTISSEPPSTSVKKGCRKRN